MISEEREELAESENPAHDEEEHIEEHTAVVASGSDESEDSEEEELRPFHMALVLMRFRCASKPNRVECASDAHWSCSHERQYLVDQLALPRLCT